MLALSVLLHLLLIGWGSGQLRIPAPHAPTQPVLDAALLTPPPKPVPSRRRQAGAEKTAAAGDRPGTRENNAAP